MNKDTSKEAVKQRGEIGLSLEDILRRGAQEIVQKAIEVELEELLEQYRDVRMLDGRRAVVRNGYLPERDVLTAVGALTVQVPKVRDRSGSEVKFNSALVPPYVRKSGRIQAALPWLYLKGISTGDMQDALSVLVGEEAKGLSSNVVSRLKQEWANEHKQWNKRPLTQRRYVYFWADGIHTGLREEGNERACLLVIMGVTEEGTKELVAVESGFRESKDSWQEVLNGLKERGLETGPRLAVGDGALGFWAALEEVYPHTRLQRCWVHKTANVLNALPKALQSKAKAQLHEIWMAPSRKEACRALDTFCKQYQAKYPKATEKLLKDREAVLAFYDFPAEHWVHLRTTNPIESTFATVRHRTTKTKNCVSRTTFLSLAFKLIQEAEKSWRKINGVEHIAELLKGRIFHDGIPVQDNPPVSPLEAA